MISTHRKKRSAPADRKREILICALSISARIGYQNITRHLIANEIGISKSLITNYFSMPQLKNAIIKAAIKYEILPVLAQVITSKDPQSKHIPRGLKNKVIKSLAL